ncbi:MAG: KH domain-containing protein [Lachnospiraceae bacterium]|nr:KH domain-containing protein [Lachnospiraceae bacterium]
MKELVETIVKALVDRPSEVRVTEEESERGTLVTVNVAKEDLGKVIGKNGRVATAIRAVVKAAGVRSGKHTIVDIDE